MLNVVRRPANDQRYALAKRAFDLISALLLILLTAPVLIVVAILVHFDSPGSVLFRQQRVGKHGRPFNMYKFRSMLSDAPRYAISPRDSVSTSSGSARGIFTASNNSPRNESSFFGVSSRMPARTALRNSLSASILN